MLNENWTEENPGAAGTTHGVNETGRGKNTRDSELDQGQPVLFDEIDPWPEQVDGGAVLQAAADYFERYLSLPDGASTAMALWALHAHCFHAFDVTPRLNVTAPEKGCGKTVTLDVLSTMLPRPVRAENLTAAVTFRIIEKWQPTLLCDEYDSWLGDNEEIRGILNAGHRKGGAVPRCIGDKHEVALFRVFSPVVLAGIGALPGTLQDRSVIVPLQRAAKGEISHRFSSRKTDNTIARKFARWSLDNARHLPDDPALPEAAVNRLADNWRPLFSIAERAGRGWPDRVADSFAKLTRDDEESSLSVELLADIRAVFDVDKLSTEQLLGELNKMPERPWSTFKHGKPIDSYWLSRKLKPFKILSKQIRFGIENHKGYYRTQFEETWTRYLSQMVG